MAKTNGRKFGLTLSLRWTEARSTARATADAVNLFDMAERYADVRPVQEVLTQLRALQKLAARPGERRNGPPLFVETRF